MIDALKGKKTYILGAAMILLSGLKAQGYIGDDVFKIVQALLLGGGLIALRAGVAKS